MYPWTTSRILSRGRLALTLAVCLLVAACEQTSTRKRPPAWELNTTPPAVVDNRRAPGENTAQAPADDAASQPDNSFYQPGSGRLAQRPRIADARVESDGDIRLNFQNANILEVVKVILGDMLDVTYVVDPKVQGSITMQTAASLREQDLVPTLELLLRMNDAALVTDADIYRVIPLANAATAVRAPQLGDSSLPLPRGFTVRVVPLRYVSVNEMVQLLEPFVSGSNQILRVDTKRNMLILAGTGGDMGRLLETIHVFDVDQMKGMSMALFTPDFVDAKTMAEELRILLADPASGLIGDLVRFVTVERLNGLIVVTPRPEILAQVRTWIERLDRDTGGTGRRLFIYRVQNGEATELAQMLTELFDSGGRPATTTPPVELAPGLQAATVGEARTPPPTTPGVSRPAAPARAKNSPPATQNVADGLSIDAGSPVRFIADEPNNALLILATAREYRQIQAALKQLDVSPMQVLVEVTIAEVSLTDNLQYGVEWFFRHGIGSATGVGTLDLGALAGINPLVPGFSYAIQGSDNVVQAVLNTLDRESNLSIISSPTLLVLNNQEASIQVGDEVPVSTQQQQSTTVDANIINSIEYRETGILLKVKPRINASGLVIMDVEQEASLVPSANNADPLTPRIQQRKIRSTVAVNSGDTIILGGLIQDNHDQSESGIPLIHQAPIIGALFGTKSDAKGRTELLVLITPRAISNRASALQVTEEFRRKLHSLVPLESRGGVITSQSAGNPERESEAPAEAAPETPPAGADKPSAATQPAAPRARLCERVGPFASKDAADGYAGAIAGARSRVIEVDVENVLGSRVTIPAYPNLTEAEAALQGLREAGFRDALLYRAGPSRGSITLGVFSRESNAERLVARVRQAGYDAVMVPATRRQTGYWLTLSRPAESTLPAGAGSGAGPDATQVDCAALELD